MNLQKNISKKNNKNNKRLFIILAILAVVLIGGGVAAYTIISNSNKKSAETSDSVDADKTSEALSGNETPIEGNNDDEKVIVPTSPSDEESVAVEAPIITRASQDGDKIKIAAIFNQPAYGTCELKIEKQNEKTITQTVAVVVGSSYYACNGFTVPRSSFTSTGTWNITITHIYSGASATSEIQTIAIN